MSYDLETKNEPVRKHKGWPARTKFEPSRSPRVNVSFEPRHYQQLMMIAKQRGISFAAAVRLTLDEVLE